VLGEPRVGPTGVHVPVSAKPKRRQGNLHSSSDRLRAFGMTSLRASSSQQCIGACVCFPSDRDPGPGRRRRCPEQTPPRDHCTSRRTRVHGRRHHSCLTRCVGPWLLSVPSAHRLSGFRLSAAFRLVILPLGSLGTSPARSSYRLKQFSMRPHHQAHLHIKEPDPLFRPPPTTYQHSA
jgi:hypothetical protein